MTYHRFWPCIGPCFLTGFYFFLVISGLWKLQYSLLCSDSLNLCLKPHCSPIMCICILAGHFLLNILSVLKCMQKWWIHNLDFSLFFPSSPEGPSAQLSGWFYIIKAHPRKHVIKVIPLPFMDGLHPDYLSTSTMSAIAPSLIFLVSVLWLTFS